MNLYIISVVEGKTQAMTKKRDNEGFNEAFQAVANHTRSKNLAMTLEQFMAGDTENPRVDFHLSVEPPVPFDDFRSSKNVTK